MSWCSCSQLISKSDIQSALSDCPGDTIRIADGVVFINGKRVKWTRIGDFIDYSSFNGSSGRAIPQFQETLPNGVTYNVLETEPEGDGDNTGEYFVPDGFYFLLGDNRDNSQDFDTHVLAMCRERISS